VVYTSLKLKNLENKYEIENGLLGVGTNILLEILGNIRKKEVAENVCFKYIIILLIILVYGFECRML
jgi:hypothetical protein